MALQDSKLLILFLLLSIEIETTYESTTSSTVSSSSSSSSSSWLKKVANRRQSECWNRPWMCSRGDFPTRSLCCRNRCVDVTSDRNNCGFCGMRCLFNMQCCAGLCTNTNIDPFNCGSCGHVCSLGNLCIFGLCGYAQQPPPPSPPSSPGRPTTPQPPCPPMPKQMPPPRLKQLLRSQPPSEGPWPPEFIVVLVAALGEKS